MIVVAHPRARPTCHCCDALVLHFADGEVHVYPQANVPARLAAGVATFLHDLIENPSIVEAITLGAPSSRVRRHSP